MPPARPAPPPAGRARSLVGWDALVAVGLGAALLAGGWLDMRAYLLGRGKSLPTFRFLNANSGQRIRFNEFFQETSTVVRLGNIGRLEWDDPKDQRTKFRQALGPVSMVEIWSDRLRAVVEFDLRSPFAEQTITAACNGTTLEEMHPQIHEEIHRKYFLELHPGSNQFTLSFTRYFPPGPGERTIAARLNQLDLYLPESNGNF